MKRTAINLSYGNCLQQTHFATRATEGKLLIFEGNTTVGKRSKK